MNSKLFIASGYAAWYFTFILGFFILAPSTDDGYYTIASLGTALKGSPGFWIGDSFSHVFFLPTAFNFIYGYLLKLTMISGFDFGAFGFRFYQFLFILLLPVVLTVMLRKLYPRDHGVRFLLFISLLSLTHFVQSASTVRPEVLGALLFLVFLSTRKQSPEAGLLPSFVLALCGTVHPIFTLLAFAVFGTGLIRRFLLFRLTNLTGLLKSLIAFAIPFGFLSIYYLSNFKEFREQTLGRASFLSTDAWSAPAVVIQDLLFWRNSSGIEFGLFNGYPAFALLAVLTASTFLVAYRRAELWSDNTLWVIWPILAVQWFVFLFLPPFLPYLAFSAFLSTLLIVLLLKPVQFKIIEKFPSWSLASVGLGMCLLFIAFQGGKFFLAPDDRLTPAGLHSAMAPILENTETKMYTDSARLIPPLIDFFSEGENIRLNFTYLSPDCLQPHLLARANEHAVTELTTLDSATTLWGLDAALLARTSNRTAQGDLRFVTKGSGAIITLTPDEEVYSDNKNLIIRASSSTVQLDSSACGE